MLFCDIMPPAWFYFFTQISYLTESKGRSRVGGQYFLCTPLSNLAKPPAADHIFNGPILAKCSILRHVMPAVAEAEIAGVFVNAKNAKMI